MEIKPLGLNGIYEITFDPKRDDRGYFTRLYDEMIFAEKNLTTRWVQENQSLSIYKGTIRGLHFQRPPHAETKLVRVAAGAILDVFVDLRKGSETYGQWDAIELSDEKLNMVYIPRGFAHGFCSLTERVLVIYKVDHAYTPEAEGGIRWNDDTLNIQWPTKTPVISDKDKILPSISDFVSLF